MKDFATVMDCPLRFKIHDPTIGFFGPPSSPIVDAMGIPMSMCAPWMSPLESTSRIVRAGTADPSLGQTTEKCRHTGELGGATVKAARVQVKVMFNSFF